MAQLCGAEKLFITLYTKAHTKSMKPHCILGSCSAQFLSIMGWEEAEERVSDGHDAKTMERKQTQKNTPWEMKRRQNRECARSLQLVVGPKQFSPNLPVPRIQQRPSEPPGEEETDKDKECYRERTDKYREKKIEMHCLNAFIIFSPFLKSVYMHEGWTVSLLQAINIKFIFWLSVKLSTIIWLTD